jgi:hypothetical protein
MYGMAKGGAQRLQPVYRYWSKIFQFQYREYPIAKKHIGRPEQEILVMVYGYHDFPKPSVHVFPEALDPADRSCRFRV